jgi:dTDP-4-amino-4,6-dideoxygalactose transaminase
VIPLASPLAQYRAHAPAIDAALRRVAASGHYVLGPEVSAFEQAFAAYCGVPHAVGAGSGTDALTLALGAFGIGAGDEVITVAHTALATVAAIVDAGATPVLIDVDRRSRTMDAARLEAAITPRTKAVIPVHLYGQPAAMDDIVAIARRRDLKIIEDCAQAVGARYRGARVGGIGDAGCFSFYPTKNLGALGDGGMVVTADADVAARLRRGRQYGWDEQRRAGQTGVNSRLDPIQAAILAAKLPSLDADNARRRAIAAHYGKGLAGLPLTAPSARAEDEPVFHLYVIECASPPVLMKHLDERGIGAAVHYPIPAHRQSGYAPHVVVPRDGLPVTEHLAGHVLSLPIYPELADGDVDRVIAAMRAFFA